MVAKTFTQVVAEINNRTSLAIQETAQEAQEMLHQCILEQYYEDPGFYPNVYNRTETFLNSVLSKMVSNTSAEVYIDVHGMHYKNGFDSMQVVEWAANSQHGANYYQTDTEPFWQRFLDLCNTNLLLILKRNMKKHGLKIQ